MTLGADLLVWNLLTDLVQRLAQGPDLWVALLGDAVTADDIERLRDLYARETPRATLGYPRQAGPWPQWTVFLQGDSPELMPLAFETGQRAEGVEKGFLLTETVEVRTWARNPNYGRVLHVLARQYLIAMRDVILGEGKIARYAYGGSRDLVPAQEFLPEDLWVRSQVWQFASVAEVAPALETGLIYPPPRVALTIDCVLPGVPGKVQVRR